MPENIGEGMLLWWVFIQLWDKWLKRLSKKKPGPSIIFIRCSYCTQ